MKAVIAIDSFKGSLSSVEAGKACSQAIREVFTEAEVTVFPLADGGEGTVDALTDGLRGEIVAAQVTGPLGEKVDSRYGFIPDRKTAVIEMADAAGLPMVPKHLRNPLNTTTYGLGELILKALDDGCRDFIIGIGGSATNDAGLGMLTALGARFYDQDEKPVGITGGVLKDIVKIDLEHMDERLWESQFHVACDVNNPLCGSNGCSFVYGPQKGATPEIVKAMDEAIDCFSRLAAEQCDIHGAELPGAGAAGGLGYAFHGFLKAQLEPGVSLILKAIGIEDKLREADVLITGEGRMDFQTSMGKAPAGVAQLAKRLNPDILTLAVCGCATAEASAVNNAGIDAYFPIIHQPMTVDEAMERATAVINLQQTVSQIMRVVKQVKK